MAKSIRSIKADLRRDETLGKLSLEARYMFVLLFGTYADDHGRFRANPALLRGELYPYDDFTREQVGGWLDELAGAGRIRLYTVDGQSYAVITSWTKHQRVDNAAKSELPEPPAEGTEIDTVPPTDPPPVAANCGELPKVVPVDNEPSAGQDRTGLGVGEEGTTDRTARAAADWLHLDVAGRGVVVEETLDLAVEAIYERNRHKVKRKVPFDRSTRMNLRNERMPVLVSLLERGFEPCVVASTLAEGRDEPIRVLAPGEEPF